MIKHPQLPFFASGQFREGVGFRQKDLHKWICTGALKPIMINARKSNSPITQGAYIMQDVEQAYKEANEEISKAQSAYKKTLDEFRSTIKNDIASISSSSAKVQAEASKINSMCAAAIAAMNSPEMLLALSNAERLAAALNSISAVRANEISIAVGTK